MHLCSEREIAQPVGSIKRAVFAGTSGHTIPVVLVLIPFLFTFCVALLLRYEYYYELSLINAPRTLNVLSYICAMVSAVLGFYGCNVSTRPLSSISASGPLCYLMAAFACIIFPEFFHVTTEAIFLRSAQLFPVP